VGALLGEGLVRLGAEEGFAAPTAKLMERREGYEAELARTLEFIKPTFNEEMRAGHTNM
jgi:hypothetical protein